MFKRVGIVAKPGDPRVDRVLVMLIDYLTARQVDLSIDPYAAEILAGHRYHALKDLRDNDRELILVVGGDGTLLRAAHMLANHQVPLIGINVGHLGFLTDISPDEMAECLEQIFAGHFLREQRIILNSRVLRQQVVMAEHEALNDVVIQKWNNARMIALDMHINDIFVHSQRSDGMIIATPTGSTAYALSGGGPILHPGVAALTLVPICPHTLSNRPLVVTADSLIEIIIGERDIDQAMLICDGESKYELLPGDCIQVRKAARQVHLIHPLGHDHFAMLRAKLQWG